MTATLRGVRLLLLFKRHSLLRLAEKCVVNGQIFLPSSRSINDAGKSSNGFPYMKSSPTKKTEYAAIQDQTAPGLSDYRLSSPHQDHDLKDVDFTRSVTDGVDVEKTSRQHPAGHRSNIKDLQFMLERYQHVSLKGLTECIEEFEEKGIHNEQDMKDAMLTLSCTGTALDNIQPDKRIELTERMWTVIRNSDMPLTVDMVNALLDAYNENEQRFDAFTLLSNLEMLDIKPDFHTYGLMIFSYCEHGDMESVSKLLDLLRKDGFSLNHAILHLLIVGHFKSDNVGAAFQVLDLMNELKLQPYFDTYRLMMELFAERGDMEGIEWVMKEMSMKGMPLKSFVLFNVVEKLIINCHSEHLPKILAKIAEDSMKDYKNAITAIKKIISQGFEEEGYNLYLNFFTEEVNRSIESDENELNGRFILNALAPNSKFEAIKPIVCHMEDRGEKRAISEMARLAMVVGRPYLGLQLLELMKERGHTIRGHMFFPIFTILKNRNNSEGLLIAFKKYHEMVDPDLKTNFSHIIYQYLFPTYFNLGKNCEECLEILEEEGYKKEEINFAYFCCIATRKSLEEALQFGNKNQMKVFYPLITPLLLKHPKLKTDWRSILQISKLCDEKSNFQQTGHHGDVLLQIISGSEEDYKVLEVLEYFMGLKLKLRINQLEALDKLFGVPVPVLKTLASYNCYTLLDHMPASWMLEKQVKQNRDLEKKANFTLFVKNLPPETTENDLKKCFPESVNIRLPREPDFNFHRGFAYITFKEASEVQKALDEKQGLQLHRNKLFLDYGTLQTGKKKTKRGPQMSLEQQDREAGVRDETTLSVRNLPINITKDDLRKCFPGCIEIRMPKNPVSREYRGFAFLTFEDPSEVEKALKEKQGLELHGNSLLLGYGSLPTDRKTVKTLGRGKSKQGSERQSLRKTLILE